MVNRTNIRAAARWSVPISFWQPLTASNREDTAEWTSWKSECFDETKPTATFTPSTWRKFSPIPSTFLERSMKTSAWLSLMVLCPWVNEFCQFVCRKSRTQTKRPSPLDSAKRATNKKRRRISWKWRWKGSRKRNVKHRFVTRLR